MEEMTFYCKGVLYMNILLGVKEVDAWNMLWDCQGLLAMYIVLGTARVCTMNEEMLIRTSQEVLDMDRVLGMGEKDNMRVLQACLDMIIVEMARGDNKYMVEVIWVSQEVLDMFLVL